MNINDLDKILQEYHKHFGTKKMEMYFNNIIKIKQKKENGNATSQKKINNNSR